MRSGQQKRKQPAKRGDLRGMRGHVRGPHLILGAVVGICYHLPEPLHHLHSSGDAPKYRVLAIEPWRRPKRDKELLTTPSTRPLGQTIGKRSQRRVLVIFDCVAMGIMIPRLYPRGCMHAGARHTATHGTSKLQSGRYFAWRRALVPRSFSYLRSVGIGASIRHRQDTSARVLELAMAFVFKLGAVY